MAGTHSTSQPPRAFPDVPFVVVGGGPAAASAARVLAESGPAARVVVVTEEREAPYDRTTLSKSVLAAPGASAPPLWPAGEPWLGRIDLRTSTRVTRLDPRTKVVVSEAGESIPYGALLLATGAAPRRLDLPGIAGPGVHYLRDVVDVDALRLALHTAEPVVVIGGGVIGLEIAATARSLGHQVEVVEAAPRILGRGVPEDVANWLADLHRSRGVRIRTGVAPAEIIRDGAGVTGVRLDDGSEIAAGLVVVGVGVTPREGLARDAGIAVDDGILVDGCCRTSHPDVFAAGDVARMRGRGGARGFRSEHYQVAGRQAEVAAAAMLGGSDDYDDVPWSWSDQFDATMQTMGFDPADGEQVRCGDSPTVVVLTFTAGLLVAACGVGHGDTAARPVRAAGKVIAAGGRLDHEALAGLRSDLGAVVGLLRDAGRRVPGPDPGARL